MKTGYTEAAWRLFEHALVPRDPRRRPPREITWADAELAGTPFVSCPLPLPLVHTRGSH